jgi:chromosome segregation ATPase
MNNDDDMFYIYNNIGKLLVSPEHVPPSFICEDPKKTIDQYKEDYYNKLMTQLKNLETNKRELLDEYDKLLVSKKLLEEKIDYLTNKIYKNDIYIRSVGNIFNFYTARLKDNLEDTTNAYDQTNTDLKNIKKKIEFLDICIFKTNEYILQTKS